MGITGGDRIVGNIPANNAPVLSAANNAQFHQDIEVNFTLSGATDNGLTFGASIQLDEAGWSDSTDDGSTSVFISGNFGTLTMGDTDGGFDWGMGEVPTGSGSIADNETGHAGFNGNSGLDGTYDGQVLRYDHSVGGLGFAVSIEIDDADGANNDPVIGLGLRYSVANINLGLGYQSTTVGGFDREVVGISAGTTVGGIAVGLNYSSQSRDNWTFDQDHVGIGASYSMDAITIGVNYGQYDNFGGDAVAERSGFGLSAGYDLGGGASILLGYGSSEYVSTGGATTDVDNWSLGLSMSF